MITNLANGLLKMLTNKYKLLLLVFKPGLKHLFRISLLKRTMLNIIRLPFLLRFVSHDEPGPYCL